MEKRAALKLASPVKRLKKERKSTMPAASSAKRAKKGCKSTMPAASPMKRVKKERKPTMPAASSLKRAKKGGKASLPVASSAKRAKKGCKSTMPAASSLKRAKKGGKTSLPVASPVKCVKKERKATMPAASPVKRVKKERKSTMPAASPVKRVKKQRKSTMPAASPVKRVKKQRKSTMPAASPVRRMKKERKSSMPAASPVKRVKKERKPTMPAASSLKRAKKGGKASLPVASPVKRVKKERKSTMPVASSLKRVKKGGKTSLPVASPVKRAKKGSKSTMPAASPVKRAKKGSKASLPALIVSYRMPVKKEGLKRSSLSTNLPTQIRSAKRAKVKVAALSFPRTSEGGIVLTCGQNEVGQLGFPDSVSERKNPAVVKSLTNVVDVCAGGMHTACLTIEGEVLTFGCNDEGGLGRDTSEEGSEFVPKKVSLPGKVVQITAGDSHSAALLEDGTVFAWGSFRDSSGSMGLSLNGVEKSPVQMLSGHVVIKIASGADHLLMLTDDGLLFTCGCGEQGQLGRLSERGASRKARQGLTHLLVPDMIKFKPRSKVIFDDVWASHYCTFAKEAQTGKIYVCGLNNHNQLGFKNVEDRTVYFQLVTSEPLSKLKVAQICGGQHHTIIRDVDGQLYAVGRKEYGRLGLGKDCSDAETPDSISSLSDKKITDVTCGTSASLAVTDEGSLYGWGMGGYQICVEDGVDIFVPAEIKAPALETRSVVLVSAGGQHTVILAVDKEVQ